MSNSLPIETKTYRTTMTEKKAIITGIEAYLPEYVLTNEELATMVDTTDEWIMSRVVLLL